MPGTREGCHYICTIDQPGTREGCHYSYTLTVPGTREGCHYSYTLTVPGTREGCHYICTIDKAYHNHNVLATRSLTDLQGFVKVERWFLPGDSSQGRPVEYFLRSPERTNIATEFLLY